MASSAIQHFMHRFEEAAQQEDDVEFWYARDLLGLLDYHRWDSFCKVIEKAKQACEASGHKTRDHFLEVSKMVNIGSGAQRKTKDVQLTRYACYLVVQNSDARKKPVAFAQTYFAIQTRRQELQDQGLGNGGHLSEIEKRLHLRAQMKERNKELASAAKKAGVLEAKDFAVFQNFGYKGLYGGLDRSGVARKKGLEPKDDILNHMGSSELAANWFRATQTEEKLQRANIQGKTKANQTHFDIGKKVRKAIKEIGDTLPEDLPKAENLLAINEKKQKSLAPGTPQV